MYKGNEDDMFQTYNKCNCNRPIETRELMVETWKLRYASEKHKTKHKLGKGQFFVFVIVIYSGPKFIVLASCLLYIYDINL